MKLNSKSINYNVQTVDELVSLDGLEGDTVVVTDENRGGVFVYREDNVGTNNGGTIFNGWTRQYDGAVNVKWFGAVEGEDSTTAIQAALNAFSDVEIPKVALPFLSNTLGINSNNILFGKGSIKSITNDSALISAYGVNTFKIKDITLIGKLSGVQDRGINIAGYSFNYEIDNVTITQFNEIAINQGEASVFSTKHPSTIKNCKIFYNGTGIYNTTEEYCNYINNVITLNGTIWSANSPSIDNYGGNAGVIGNYSGWGMFGAFGNCKILGNSIQQNFYGLALVGSVGTNPDHSSIANNQINHNQAYGLYISNVVNCESIIGNEVLSTVGAGQWSPIANSISVVLYNCGELVFTGNTFDGGSINHIRFDNVFNCKFVGNIFYPNGTIVEASQSDNNSFVGNTFMGTSTVTHHANTTKVSKVGNSFNGIVNGSIKFLPTFNSSWNTGIPSKMPLRYWKDDEGMLNIYGVIYSTNIGDVGGVIFTLPVGYRPSYVIDMPVRDTSSANVFIRVYSDGGVQMIGGGISEISIGIRIPLSVS